MASGGFNVVADHCIALTKGGFCLFSNTTLKIITIMKSNTNGKTD